MSCIDLRIHTQDPKYVNKEKKLLRTLKFPKEYELKVDLTRVNWEVRYSCDNLTAGRLLTCLCAGVRHQ